MIFKIALLFLAGVIVPAITVQKCYECEYFDYHNSNETNNEKCKESDLPDDFLITCNDTIAEGGNVPTDWQCSLVRGRIEVDEENFEIVKRACVPGKLLTTECKNTKGYQTDHGFIKRGSECICDDKDGCNAGNNMALGIGTLGFGLVLSQLLRM